MVWRGKVQRMRVAIIPAGSRADGQPYVALGLGLLEVESEVCLTTYLPFNDFIRDYGLGD
jgi:UDP:flavonoid glycosyltransferase YjiC (YdhE family)